MYSQKFNCLLCLKQDSFFSLYWVIKRIFQSCAESFLHLLFHSFQVILGSTTISDAQTAFSGLSRKNFSFASHSFPVILGYTTISDDLTGFSGLSRKIFSFTSHSFPATLGYTTISADLTGFSGLNYIRAKKDAANRNGLQHLSF